MMKQRHLAGLVFRKVIGMRVGIEKATCQHSVGEKRSRWILCGYIGAIMGDRLTFGEVDLITARLSILHLSM